MTATVFDLHGTVLPPTAPSQGSRRRRLWELDAHAHCPLIGVCLPIAALRKLADKVLGGHALADEYELHCGVITDCRIRTRLAEAVQRELDRRCMLALRQVAKLKTSEALAAWWLEASQGRDLAGAFWAVLTHARCTPELEQKVLGDVHMMQHQVGMARRVDLQRFEALIEENGALARELGALKLRTARQSDDAAQRREQQQCQVVRLRAELIGRDTRLAALRDELGALEAAVPELKARRELAADNEHLHGRLQDVQRTLNQVGQDAERQRRRADELAAELQRRDAAATLAAQSGSAADAAARDADLRDRAVLCVGGRAASVPIYRELIEGTGGRFLHHDGGSEDNVTQLDATLAAADLVICQTGCISHDAYWRVKDHCKRTGKRCVFVESPSSAGLRRALLTLAPAPTD